MSAIQKLNKMQEKLDSTVEWCKRAHEIIADLNTKLIALEMTNISLANTLNATVTVLNNKGLASDDEVLVELRIIQDNRTRQEISAKVADKKLLHTSMITKDAAIICAHYRNGKKISDYRFMNVDNLLDDSKTLIIGQPVGTTFCEKVGDDENEFIVREIYEYI